jgi:hypothetical protein
MNSSLNGLFRWGPDGGSEFLKGVFVPGPLLSLLPCHHSMTFLYHVLTPQAQDGANGPWTETSETMSQGNLSSFT